MSFLFGSTKEKTTVPDWLKEPAMEMLQRSVDMGKTGYMPYAGPQVAAFDPAQIASMQNTNDAAGAFGMRQAMPNIPQATDYGNGISGYSSMPLYQQQQDWMTANRPGQKMFYDSFFIDPVTGVPGANVQQPQASTGGILDLTPEQMRNINEWGFQPGANYSDPGDFGGMADQYGGAGASPGGFNGETGQTGGGLGGFFGGLF